MAYKTILVAFDGSPDALLALETAALVRASGSMRMHLLHCPAPISGLTSAIKRANTYDEQVKQAAAIFDKARAILDKRNIPFQAHVRRGDPGMEIVRTAKELGCEVIFMGTRGLGGLASLVLGSVSQAVLKHADVPVILANNVDGK